MRFSDDELSLIKNTFADNDELLVSIRNHFMGLNTTKEEQAMFQNLVAGKKEMVVMLRKFFLPELDPKAPIGQTIDLWRSININETPGHLLAETMEARELLISTLSNVFSSIENGKDIVVDLSVNKENLVGLMMRNIYISHVEGVVMQISILAGQKQETVDETKRRLEQNSTK